MSLINQMLQELEQRKATASAQAHPELKQTTQPLQVVAVPRKNKWLQYAVLAALCLGGAYGMRWLSHPAMPQGKQTTGLRSASGVIGEAQANPKPVPALSEVAEAASMPVDANAAAVSQTLMVANLFVPSLDKTLDVSFSKGIQIAAPLPEANRAIAPKVDSQEKPLMLAAVEPHPAMIQKNSVEAPMLALTNAQPKPKPSNTPTTEPNATVSKAISTEQQAAHRYQQAIAYLQQGRVAEAQDQLKSAVDTFPAHNDARQTLVGLLVDNKRHDEAMQVLKVGLQHAPHHTGYAQALARLQLDAGMVIEALSTLESNSAGIQVPQDYHALMAVVLQKTGRHDQAINHYQQALRLGAAAPAWYIGLGVSLQAEGRAQEAKLAYQQAQASQLSPELAMFVSQRLKQVQ
jgi:MSHA biogenesis protein MshN